MTAEFRVVDDDNDSRTVALAMISDLGDGDLGEELRHAARDVAERHGYELEERR